MTAATLTLTDFLLARIAEDEAAAKAAAEAESPSWWVDGPAKESGKFWIYAVGEKFQHQDVADHIARHDPARVLAECEAKRRIVELHQSWPVLVEMRPVVAPAEVSDPQSYALRASQQIAWLTEQEYRTKFGDEPPTAPVMAALAAVYADHPDYREEWACA